MPRGLRCVEPGGRLAGFRRPWSRRRRYVWAPTRSGLYRLPRRFRSAVGIRPRGDPGTAASFAICLEESKRSFPFPVIRRYSSKNASSLALVIPPAAAVWALWTLPRSISRRSRCRSCSLYRPPMTVAAAVDDLHVRAQADASSADAAPSAVAAAQSVCDTGHRAGPSPRWRPPFAALSVSRRLRACLLSDLPDPFSGARHALDLRMSRRAGVALSRAFPAAPQDEAATSFVRGRSFPRHSRPRCSRPACACSGPRPPAPAGSAGRASTRRLLYTPPQASNQESLTPWSTSGMRWSGTA